MLTWLLLSNYVIALMRTMCAVMSVMMTILMICYAAQAVV